MTAFYYIARGGAELTLDLAPDYYYRFQGLNRRPGIPWLDPNTGLTTRFPLSGDPITGKGWIDGQVDSFGDRSIGLASGPFTMAPGDTQEIICAEIAGLGSDRLSSVSVLKSHARIAQQVFEHHFAALPPFPSVSVGYTNSQSSTLLITADARSINTISILALLKKYDDATLASASLFDDGSHHDGAAGDGVYGNVISIAPQSEGLYLNLNVSYAGGSTVTWAHMADSIPTMGPLQVSTYSIVSDNINSDGIVNPGENIRYVVALQNASPFTLSDLSVTVFPRSASKPVLIGVLNAQSSVTLNYDPNNLSTYLSFDVDSRYADSKVNILLVITNARHNMWVDTLTFFVQPFTFPLHKTTVTHKEGRRRL